MVRQANHERIPRQLRRMKGPDRRLRDDCKVRKPVRRDVRWSASAGRRSIWLAGAWTSGQETIPGNHPKRRRAFNPVLTKAADTSPRPGRRSVGTSSSQLRSFTWRWLFSMLQWLRNNRSNSLGSHLRGLRLVSRYRPSLVTSPVAMSTLTLSTIAACLAPGNSSSSRM